jgi:hypothetical protein
MADVEHDDYCPDKGDRRCDCNWEARIRADEREREAVRNALDESRYRTMEERLIAMAGRLERFSVTEYPDGRVRSLIVDGTHWVPVSSANTQESIGVSKALADIRSKVEGLVAYSTRMEHEWDGERWVPSDKVITTVLYSDVIDIIDRASK